MLIAADKVLAERPQFHRWSDGKPTSWALSDSVLRYMRQCLSPGMKTLETGAGYSTVIFAVSGADHTCVTPAESEKIAILSYLARCEGQPTVRFVLGPSDRVLPTISDELGDLDFVFIDGAHRFPLPVIDFHYTEAHIKVGGVLGVDDVNMPSVRVLYDFVRGEAEWQLIAEVDNTAFFRRLRPTQIVSDWQGQRMNSGLLGGVQAKKPRGRPSFLSRFRR